MARIGSIGLWGNGLWGNGRVELCRDVGCYLDAELLATAAFALLMAIRISG